MSEDVTVAERQAVYAEGRKAFEDGRSRLANPYIGRNERSANIWWYGWDTAKKDSAPPKFADDPDKTIPRPNNS